MTSSVESVPPLHLIVGLTFDTSLTVGADLDHNNPEVQKDLLDWGTWIVQETGHVGFRFDAIKVGIDSFMDQFILMLILDLKSKFCPQLAH